MLKRSRAKEEGGFTLVEIMIVVAIIGILASIAIPNFMVMQLRSKRSESPLMLSGLVMAEKAYFQAFGTYLNTGVSPRPDKALDGEAVAWTACSGDGTCNWGHLGFLPDQPVRCNYEAWTSGDIDFPVAAADSDDKDEPLVQEDSEPDVKPDVKPDTKDEYDGAPGDPQTGKDDAKAQAKKELPGASERQSKGSTQPTFHALSVCDIDNDEAFTYFYGSATKSVGFELPGDELNY